MKNLLKICFLSLVSVLCLLSGGCEHKELCYHHPHSHKLEVVFDWSNAPDASPRGMCVFFYPLTRGGYPMRFDFEGRTGGEIELFEGDYAVLCYNNDTELSLVKGMEDYYRHGFYTREGSLFEPVLGPSAGVSPRASGSESERSVVCPDQIWGDRLATVTVTGLDQVITLYPNDLLCHYSYEIRNVKGLDRVARMCASLSGMAPSLTLQDERLDTESVTLPFLAEKGDDTTIVGEFLTFGHHEENADPHKMMLYVWMNDGTRFAVGGNSEKYNLTDQVHAAPNRRRVHLIIDGLDLPEPIEGDGGGFDAGFDDWGEINEDIHI